MRPLRGGWTADRVRCGAAYSALLPLQAHQSKPRQLQYDGFWREVIDLAGMTEGQERDRFNRSTTAIAFWRSERKEWPVDQAEPVSSVDRSGLPMLCDSMLTSLRTVDPLESRRPKASTKRS